MEETKLQVSNESIFSLKSISKWSKFISIAGFVFVALMIVFAFSFSAIMASIPGQEANSAMPFAGFGFIYLIMGGIYFVPIFFLFKFSTLIKKAISKEDQRAFNSAFDFLSRHYSFIGVLTAIMVGLYVIMGVIWGVIAMTAGSSGLNI